MNNIILNQEQEQAVETMLSGKNVFITGFAGSGKTTIINEFKRRCNRQLVCLAPTGAAAQSIGGATLHSFFKLPIGPIENGSLHICDNRQYGMLQTVETILIDEVSMCRSDAFQALDFLLREAARPECQQLPFGGKQIIVIGDFFQLPPVVDDLQINQYLETVLGGFYAFNTQAWTNGNFEWIQLNQIHRQSDPFFLKLLEAVRNNTPDLAHYLHIINEKLVKPGVAGDSIAICCAKVSATAINNAAMSQLPDTGFINQGFIDGNFPYSDLPAVLHLQIKLGTRVMLLANKRNQMSEEFDYVNGSTGLVIGYDPSKPSVTVKLDNGKIVIVGEYYWSNFGYELAFDEYGKTHIDQVEIGRFRQLPLAQSYAITIHKSQGQTLNKAHVVLGRGCFVFGQLYTALSRVRSLQGLTLESPIGHLDAMVDLQIIDFYERMRPST